jgi:hypothetical protein
MIKSFSSFSSISCPDKNRLAYLLLFTSGLTILLIFIAEATGDNLFSPDPKHRYDSKEQPQNIDRSYDTEFQTNSRNSVKRTWFFPAVFLGFIAMIYTLYLYILYMFEPGLGEKHITSIIPYEDTMMTMRTCIKENPLKTFGSYEGSRRYFYTGGFSSFAIFVSIGIFLTWFGFSFMDEFDPERTDDWFVHIADSSICIGIFTCIISFIDLVLI